jgi:hypothetical protein
MKEQKILEYQRKLNKTGKLSKMTFGEVLVKVIKELGTGLTETRKAINKYLDEEFEG